MLLLRLSAVTSNVEWASTNGTGRSLTAPRRLYRTVAGEEGGVVGGVVV